MSHASTLLYTYAIALGSNQSLTSGLGPVSLLETAMEALDSAPLALLARSPVLKSAPIGPSRRRYANAVAIIETDMPPPALLTRLHDIENRYGRRRRQRWGARTLDLDIILWSGGIWSSAELAIPHVAFRDRDFVLRPLARIAPDWRDPVCNLSIRQLAARLNRRKPVDHCTKPL